MIALICLKPMYPALAPIMIDWYGRPIDGLLDVQGLSTDDCPDLLEAHLLEAHVTHGGAHID